MSETVRDPISVYSTLIPSDILGTGPAAFTCRTFMHCPYCQAQIITQLKRTTTLGYSIFRCHSCKHDSNERTGTPFNHVQVPTDIIFEVLLCRMRYKLSYRDVAEYFLFRGFEFTHETVRDWEERFLPVFREQIRQKRKGKVGNIWKIDETYVKIRGKWGYLYRGIDEYGNLIDVRLSQTRDMEGTQAFFAQAREIADHAPDKIQTDGLASYPRAVKEELGAEVEHEVLPCTANAVGQSHRGIKHRYYPMLGFGAFASAQRFCQAFDEVHNFLRPRCYMGEVISLNERRERFSIR